MDIQEDMEDILAGGNACTGLRYVDGAWEWQHHGAWFRLDGSVSAGVVDSGPCVCNGFELRLSRHYLEVSAVDGSLTYKVHVPSFTTIESPTLVAVWSGSGLCAMLHNADHVAVAMWGHEHAVNGEFIKYRHARWQQFSHTAGSPVMTELGCGLYVTYALHDCLEVRNLRATLLGDRAVFQKPITGYAVGDNGTAVVCFGTLEIIAVDITTRMQRSYNLGALGLQPRALCALAVSPLHVGQIACGCRDGTVVVTNSTFTRLIAEDELPCYKSLRATLQDRFHRKCAKLKWQDVTDCFDLPPGAADPKAGKEVVFCKRSPFAKIAPAPEQYTLRLVIGTDAPSSVLGHLANVAKKTQYGNVYAGSLFLMYGGVTQVEIDYALRRAIQKGNLAFVDLLFKYGGTPVCKIGSTDLSRNPHLSYFYYCAWNNTLMLALFKSPSTERTAMISSVLAHFTSEDFLIGENAIRAMTSEDYISDTYRFEVDIFQKLLERGCPMDDACLEAVLLQHTRVRTASHAENFWSPYTMRLILKSGVSATAATVLLRQLSGSGMLRTNNINGLHRYQDAIKVLLEHGADPNAQDSSMPLCRAIERGDALTIKRLFDRGAKIGLMFNPEPETPIDIACEVNRESALAACLVRGMHPPQLSNLRVTAALNNAAQWVDLPMQRWLHAFGAETRLSNKWTIKTHKDHCPEMRNAVRATFSVAAALQYRETSLRYLPNEVWIMILELVPSITCWWPLWWARVREM